MNKFSSLDELLVVVLQCLTRSLEMIASSSKFLRKLRLL